MMNMPTTHSHRQSATHIPRFQEDGGICTLECECHYPKCSQRYKVRWDQLDAFHEAAAQWFVDYMYRDAEEHNRTRLKF